MDNTFRLGEKYEDYYKNYPDVRLNKNGIMVKKSIERFNDGTESVLFIAEMIFDRNHMTIGLAHTEEEIEAIVQQFLESTQNLFQLMSETNV